MITSVTFHPLAEIELNDAAQYYEGEMKGLGEDFLTEVEHGIEQIQQHPESGAIILKVVRKKILRRFPYNIFYSIVGQSIHILALSNQKRRPFYWYQRR